MAAPLLLWAAWAWHGSSVLAQPPSTAPAETRPMSADPDRGESELPPALPEPFPSMPAFRAAEPGPSPTATAGDHAVPLRLADAIRRSLANVQTVQANVAVRTARSPGSTHSRISSP